MKLKIIHIVNDLVVGGVSVVLYDLVKNHRESIFNYEIVNLTGVTDTHLAKQFQSLNIPIHNLNYQFEGGYSLIDQFKKAFLKRGYRVKNKKNISFIAGLNANILHFHTLPRELMLGREIVRINEAKLVYTDHVARVNKNEIKAISNYLIRIPFKQFYKDYHVIAVGQAVANYLENFKIDAVLKSLIIISNKIQDSDIRISYNMKQEYKVVYVARISLVKGHEKLIEAWSLLPELNLHLYIIGPDEMNGLIQEMVAKNNFKNKITFTGSINNVSEFIKDADMGVFPSYKEGLPIALLEKMQIGIPCIVSDIEDLSHVILDNKNGLTFKLKDSLDFAEKIIKLSNDVDLRIRLGTNASQAVTNLYVSKLGGLDKEYESLYKKLIV